MRCVVFGFSSRTIQHEGAGDHTCHRKLFYRQYHLTDLTIELR